jgi:adenylate kinase
MSLNVVLLGPPGAGKGTLAAVLQTEHGVPHISTGDILRAEVKQESPLGVEAKSFMDRGKLVPDALVISIVRKRLSGTDTKKGFLLDGFPRNEEQALELDKSLKEIDRKLDVALYFKTSEKMILKRLTGRRICTQCGKIYNIPNYMPKKEGICDVCDSALMQREDDKAETVLKRLKVYENQTAALVTYYQRLGLLNEISGDTSVDDLRGVVKGIFKSLIRS